MKEALIERVAHMCPFCGNFQTQEVSRVQVWDICHNTCTWVQYLCLNCDRTFRVLI